MNLAIAFLVAGFFVFAIIAIWEFKQEREKNIELKFDAEIKEAHHEAEEMSNSDLNRVLHDRLSDPNKKT